jgi:hypothetical protein
VRSTFGAIAISNVSLFRKMLFVLDNFEIVEIQELGFGFSPRNIAPWELNTEVKATSGTAIVLVVSINVRFSREIRE